MLQPPQLFKFKEWKINVGNPKTYKSNVNRKQLLACVND